VRSTTELRDAILTAARAEFAQYGLAGSRIDRIAKAASASKERLYAHFGDKETLFRDVAATDGRRYFTAFAVRPDAVEEFVGDIFDLARSNPEHLRMLTWARLEGLPLDPADLIENGEGPSPDQAISAIVEAQAAGHVDMNWEPTDLLAMLFGIGLAWVQFPDLARDAADDKVAAARRASAIAAARRVIAPASG
jgi:AcrR family transcriptional regulator